MTRILAIITTTCLTLAACGGTGDGGEATTSTATSTSTTAPETTAAPSSTTTTTTSQATTGPQASEPFPGRGDTALLTSVDVAQQGDVARITFSFEGDVVPAYRVEYVEPPITGAGSGQEIDIGGTAFLQVTTNPGAGVDLSGSEARETFSGEDRFAPDQAGSIVEVAETGDFESVLTWVIGLDERLPFGVTADAGTLTIDIHEGATSDASDESTALGESPAECTSPTGYSVSYPASWWANDGSVTDACGLFGPEPVDLEPATDVNAPINIFIDPVSFEVAAAPTETGEEIARAITLIDGARAVRLVTRAGDGLLPQGTEVTSYVVDVATGDENRTMIMTTADVDAYDYDRNVGVLDAMARTLDLDIDTASNLVARYMGGGTPFEVTATVDAGAVCMTVSPPGEEVCLSPLDEEEIVADTVDDVAIGIAAPGVFQVEAADGISYLPTAIAGTDARGWALPIDGSPRIVAVDRSGDQIATFEVGS